MIKHYFFTIIYGDHHCSKEKIDGYKNNSENSSTTKLSEQIASGSSMSTIPSFKGIENKCNVVMYVELKTVWRISWFFKRARNRDN